MPVFINTRDLNIKSAASPLLVTQKFFLNLSYSWPDCCESATPYFGAGAEIEFEGINSRNSYQPADTTMGQASFWLKGGAAF